MKLLLALLTITLTSCATKPFKTQNYIWPKTSTSPATTQTKIELATTQIDPTTTKVTTAIIQRGHPSIQRSSNPVQATHTDIRLLWVNQSHFYITANHKPLLSYQKQKNNTWLPTPITPPLEIRN